MCSYAAYCLSSTAAARVWLEQYALELYLLEQRVLLKQPYPLELYLLEQCVLSLEQRILLKQPYPLKLYVLE